MGRLRSRLFIWGTAAFLLVLCGQGQAGPPLPTHMVEGYSGIFITPTAYFANPAESGEFWGRPSVSGTFAAFGEKDFESFVVTENIKGKYEFGYAVERIGLGDWPADVKAATGLHVDNHAVMHNFNQRMMVVKENQGDCQWLPAITLGSHFKWNDSCSNINRQLMGTPKMLGSDHSWGWEFTATATKTFAGLLPKPLIVSGGLRNGDAIHTGLLGFTGSRETTFEGSLIYFLTDDLLMAAEYRQKPDLCNQLFAGGKDLVKEENDWWDVCLAVIIDEHTTFAAGYADFGSILNHRAGEVFAMQLKYEF